MSKFRYSIKRLRHFGRDDKGQMLTEMAVAVPMVLFMFFALLQYLMTVNTRLAGQYAAFAAARAYTVHLSADADDAQTFAKLSASLAYAPVSGPAPGELTALATQGLTEGINQIPGLGSSGLNVGSVIAGLFPNTSFLDSALGALPKPLRNFAIAYLRNGFHARDIEISRPDSRYNLPQFTMRMNYQLPLWMPGFAGLYNFVGNEQTTDDFNIFVGESPALIVRSICTMGDEPWSGRVNNRSDNRDTAENSEEEPLESFDELIEETQQQQQALEDVGEELNDAQNSLALARQQRDALQQQCDNGNNTACAQLPQANANVAFWEGEVARLRAERDALANDLGNSTNGTGL